MLRPIHRVRLRSKQAGLSAPLVSPVSAGSTLDRWSKRFAEVSQIGVFVLGIFGYIYTVLPVYNKAKLEQQIEEKAAALEATKRELAEAIFRVDQAREQLAKAERDIADSHERLSLAQRDAMTFRQKSEAHYREIRLRLVSDLEIFGRASCPLFPKGATAIQPCLRELIASPTFDSWTPADRSLALRQVQAIQAQVVQVERQALERIASKQAAHEAERSEYGRACGSGASASGVASNCISRALRVSFSADDLKSFQAQEQLQTSRLLYEALREALLAKMTR